MVVPVVTGDVDAGAVEELMALCVRYHRIRTGTADPADLSHSDTQDGTGATDRTDPQNDMDTPGCTTPQDGTADGDRPVIPAGLIAAPS